jgi:cytochrome b6
VRTWLQERTPLASVLHRLRHKTVPIHDHDAWYYLGGIILVSMAMLIVTGTLLAVYYQPAVQPKPGLQGPYESVRMIVNDLPHGWWIRSIHHWSAHLMIASLLIHSASTLMLKSYRRPREVLWWTGLLLIGLGLMSGFTGYLLPWNALSFAATRIGANIAGAVPLAGPLFTRLLLGGPDVTDVTLTRFYALHIAVLPLLIVMTIILHLVLVVHHGSSVPPSVEKASGNKRLSELCFWPEFLGRELRVWVLVIMGLFAVSFALPPPAGQEADPLAPTPGRNGTSSDSIRC